MAVKSNFASGEVLTASDTNTYLTNGGLVYVTSQTVGTGVSSVTVTGAFNSTYDNYRVVYSGGVGSILSNMRLQLGSRTSGYYGFLVYGTFSATTVFGINDNNQATFRYISGADTVSAQAVFDLTDAFPARQTSIMSTLQNGTSMGYYTGRNANAESYTAFTLSPDAGTLTGGTITVYGYRKA